MDNGVAPMDKQVQSVSSSLSDPSGPGALTSLNNLSIESDSASIDRIDAEGRCRPGEFLTPQEVIDFYPNMLSHFEQKEILKYKEIYYLGSKESKKAYQGSTSFHTKDGLYIFYERCHMAYRYEVLKIIGKGSFGQVVKAFDHKTQKHVALKVVRRGVSPESTRMEVSILLCLNSHVKNVSRAVRMLEFFQFRGHWCIVFELLSFSLYQLIKINRFQGLTLDLVRQFAVQILYTLTVLHTDLEVIHCDLKPENILLQHPHRSSIRVIDFGSSCRKKQTMYAYVQSRFYRAPEVILRCKYDTAIDFWSFGCILCELATGVVLFPGENDFDQIALYVELLGTPPRKVYADSECSLAFFNANGTPHYCTYFKQADGTTAVNGYKSPAGKYRGPPGSRSWSSALKNCSDELFVDFVKRCLKWDPNERLNEAQAYEHPWLNKKCRRPALKDVEENQSKFKALFDRTMGLMSLCSNKLATVRESVPRQ